MFTKIQEQMLTQVLRMVNVGLKVDTESLQDIIDKFPESFDEFLKLKELVEKRIFDYDAALLTMNSKLDCILEHLGEPTDVRRPDDQPARRVAGQFGIPHRPPGSIADPGGR